MILAPPGGIAEIISELSQTVHISWENGMHPSTLRVEVSRFLFQFAFVLKRLRVFVWTESRLAVAWINVASPVGLWSLMADLCSVSSPWLLSSRGCAWKWKLQSLCFCAHFLIIHRQRRRSLPIHIKTKVYSFLPPLSESDSLQLWSRISPPAIFVNISLQVSGSWDFYLIVFNVDLIGTYTLYINNFTFFQCSV